MKKVWIVGVLVMAAGWGGYRVVVGAGEAPPASISKGLPAEKRQTASDFRLNDLEGRPVTLLEHKGKVVLVDFWATWCPPCRQEIPHFNALYSDYRSHGFEIIGISLDEGGPEVVRDFAKEYRVLYPLVMGNRQVTQAYGGIRGLPTTFLIDKQGRIAYKYAGYQDKGTFEQAIQALLSEQRTANSAQ